MEFSFLLYKLNYYPLLYELNKLVYACQWDNFAFVSKPQNCFHLLRFTTNKYISITTYHARQTPVFSTSDIISQLSTSDYFWAEFRRGYSVTANRSHEYNDSGFLCCL